MPVRKIPPNYRSLTGRLALYSSRASAEHESLLERDFLLLCSLDPRIAAVEVQPVRLYYRDAAGRRWPYTPDAHVRFATDPSGRRPPDLWVEVKFRQEIRDTISALRPKIRAAYHYAREHGGRFRVIHEGHIRTPRLENLKFLRPSLRGPRDRHAANRLLGALRRAGRTTPEQLLTDVGGGEGRERARLLPTLWRLIAGREIGADLDLAPLTLRTALWPGAPAGPGEKGGCR